MTNATKPAVDLLALDHITNIEQRVRLMISYLQLFKLGVVSQALPHSTYVTLLRDAKPEQRARLTTKLLELSAENPTLGIAVPTELLVLAVYETSDVSELVSRLPWTEAVRDAIEDVAAAEARGNTRRTIPIELRIPRRVFAGDDNIRTGSKLNLHAMLRVGKAPEILAALGNYRRLRVAGVINERMPSELATRILDTVRDPSDRIAAADWASRAGLLTATHFGRCIARAIEDITDAEQQLAMQLWYMQLLAMGTVHEPLPAALVARSICWTLAEGRSEQFHEIMELIPAEQIDDLSIQAALETAPSNGVRSGDTAPHTAVPGALWQSIREVA